MSEDIWSRWLLKDRFADDSKRAEEMLDALAKIRDHVLENAHLEGSEVLLDVGCGDGLIGFGALDRLAKGHVVFSDISSPLLDRCREIATESRVLDRVDFVEASAEVLSPIADASIDVVTTRSVLIYVKDKLSAFREFLRVLRPGGRVSLFEPINSYKVAGIGASRPAEDSPVADLARRLREYYERLQPPDSDPMLDFGEKDLLRLARDAGFREVELELRANLRPLPACAWDLYVSSPGNPRIPAVKDAMTELFTPEEAARYEAFLRPRVESGGEEGLSAVAFLSAVKGDS